MELIKSLQIEVFEVLMGPEEFRSEKRASIVDLKLKFFVCILEKLL